MERNVAGASPTRRHVLGGGALALAGMLGAIGCAGAQSADSSQEGKASGEPVKLLLMARSSEGEAYNKRAVAFMEKFPRIRVEVQALPGDYREVVRTNAAAGTLGDVVYLQNLLFEGLAVGGTIQQIDKLVQRDKVNLKQWYDNAIDALRIEGKMFGLPGRGQIQNCFWYYNKDAFAQAGLREPSEQSTLNDLVAAADRLTVRGDGGKFGYGVMWGNFQRITSAIRRFGGELLSADGKKCLADTPQALAAMEWHWDLWHRKQVMAIKPATPAEFGNGNIAMAGQFLAGDRGSFRTAVKDSFKWSTLLLPKGPTGKIGADLSVAPLSINAKARAVDQSWEVMKWFTDREAGVALAIQTTGSNTPGARKDVYCDERVLSDPLYPRAMMEGICKAMDIGATVPYSIPANYRQAELDEVITKHTEAFRENRTVPNPATMRAMTTEAQAILDRPR